jgi:DNA modification methylase
MEIINYPIKPEKEKSWHFKSHPYFTKQASNVVATYIEHYSKVGDTILDPFGGTGVTAIEALRLKRKAVIVDINPLACFLVRQTCEQTNVNELINTFNELELKVKHQIEEIYATPNEKLLKTDIKYWYPKNIALPKNSDFEFVEDLYTPKQLYSYAFLFAEIKKIENLGMREMMKYVFSSTMAKVNLTYMDNVKRGAEGGGSSLFGKYRYWQPTKVAELNVWKNFAKKFEYIRKGKDKWNELTKDFSVAENLQVINGSALEISEYMAANSIDYIYTDPPYGGNIAYLDLSTMWNAWLFPEIFENNKMDELKKVEIIEGGDLNKSQDEYSELFSKSFEEMGKVLKKDAWLNCVFAHKKLEFWNVIIESCEDNGMEFKGSIFQPTNNSSMHYKDNPATVLCSQRVANFEKTFNKSIREKPDNIEKFILNEIERAILETNGASIDRIYNRVLDGLHKTRSTIEAKKKGYLPKGILQLDKFLSDETLFVREPETQVYQLKTKKVEHYAYAQHLDQLRIYLKELFYKYEALTTDEIHKELFEIFKEDKTFPIEKDLPKLIYEMTYIAKKGKYKDKLILRKSEKIIKGSLDFSTVSTSNLVKITSDGHSHSEIIFRLVKIGEYLGFKSWIGKREQSVDSFQGIKFSELSLPNLTLAGLENSQGLDSKNLESKIKKIEQIDVIWIDKLGFCRYAFEVEESTSIVSGFERFKNLLEIDHNIAQKLFIVAPKSRERKLIDVFKTSTYIGTPIYLENKVQFIFKENLVGFYDSHLDKNFTETDLKMLYNLVSLN